MWDCAVVGLTTHPNRPTIASFGVLDFRVIRQRWLRDLTREALRALRPTVNVCNRYVQVAAIASAALAGRPNGDAPDRLGAGDMTAVCQAIKTARKQNGGEYSAQHIRGLLGWWRRLVGFARTTGLMEGIPGTFSVRLDHLMGRVEVREDDIGRAIPEEWIAHLDAHLHLLGTTSNYTPRGWEAEDLREVYRVFYQLIRDTGRRPGEIARLPRRPVEYVNGQPSLVYNNWKTRRHGRRLPIDESTAKIVERWEAKLDKLPVPPECADHLFPAPGTRNNVRIGHLSPHQFYKMFLAWVAAVPAPTGMSEEASDFPVEDIEPYGFRHSYAQRHADNGTPVDVLRDLMDHKEINTTMGYYRVTLKRKQHAVRLVSQLAVDRNGSPAPFATDLAYERSSVATAYGNCTEPSNVKAGGRSCPIRFQCAGCGFYRPDPSYLAAIEQHLAQLRADRAVALVSDVARWVLDNLDEQISSYDKIAAVMREQMAALPQGEQHAIESACADLRKARQSVLIPIDALTRRPSHDDI